jgi:hypothetical protein
MTTEYVARVLAHPDRLPLLLEQAVPPPASPTGACNDLWADYYSRRSITEKEFEAMRVPP